MVAGRCVSASVKRVFQRADRCGSRRDSVLRRRSGGKVRPVGRDKRFTAVGQDHSRMQPTVAMRWSKNGEGFTSKWIARTNNGDSLGQVLMIVSVSRFLLIPSRVTWSSVPWRTTLTSRESAVHCSVAACPRATAGWHDGAADEGHAARRSCDSSYAKDNLG